MVILGIDSRRPSQKRHPSHGMMSLTYKGNARHSELSQPHHPLWRHVRTIEAIRPGIACLEWLHFSCSNQLQSLAKTGARASALVSQSRCCRCLTNQCRSGRPCLRTNKITAVRDAKRLSPDNYPRDGLSAVTASPYTIGSEVDVINPTNIRPSAGCVQNREPSRARSCSPE